MMLKAPERWEVQKVRAWRNKEPEFLRTPYLLTTEMQDEFYDNVISNRGSNHRYFSMYNAGVFVGFGGLTNIEWENGCAEISLIIAPQYRWYGLGNSAVYELCKQGFHNMRLEVIYGEVFHCGNVGFWESVIDFYGGYKTTLMGRKYFDDELHDSMWFSLSKKQWESIL